MTCRSARNWHVMYSLWNFGKEENMKEGKRQEPEIRFITSNYEELFRIPNGGTILVTFPDRQFIERCEYIDDYHLRAGNSIYHISQYAEILEQNGAKCEPEPPLDADQGAWNIGHREYLLIQKSEEGWDYTIYSPNYREIDGGLITNPRFSLIDVREDILEDYGMASKVRISVDYETIERLVEQEVARQIDEVLKKIEQNEILYDTPEESCRSILKERRKGKKPCRKENEANHRRRQEQER